MQNRLIAAFTLGVYSAILVSFLVLKTVSFKIGHVMFNFSGYATGPGNFVPFSTILPYLLGEKGAVIAFFNLVGNVVLFVPVGFLAPFVFPKMTWRKSVLLAVFAPLVIEGLQVVFRVGIFDIDDVILNALGVMIGYFAFVLLSKWVRAKNYKNILIAAVVCIAAVAAVFYVVYPWGEPVTNPRMSAGGVESGEEVFFQSEDLCGGTGGNGEIVSVGNDTFTLLLGDDENLIVNLIPGATIETQTGLVPLFDLKTGDRVTLVGSNNRDGTFTADAVVVCST